MKKYTYKYLSRLSLVTLFLLGITVLAGCNDENEDEKEKNGPRFNIRVAAEDYGYTDLSRAVTGAVTDTVITPIDDDLYMEAILRNDTEQAPMSRAEAETSAANIKPGTLVTILAYAGNTYKGKIEGAVNTNGTVVTTGSQLYLVPGNYTFVCLANVEIDPSYTFFYALKGKNSMSGVVNKTINAGEPVCNLSFMLQHKVGQIRVTLKSELVEPFKNVNALLSSIRNLGVAPTKQTMILPSTAENVHGYQATLKDVLFQNVTGYAVTSKDENYYIAGYDYTTNTGIALNITSGTIDGKSLAGKCVTFNKFDVQYNRINTVDVTFKRKNQAYSVAFSSGLGGTISGTGGSGAAGTVVSSTARATGENSFKGWYKNNDSTPMSTNPTLTVTLGETENGNTYTAKFVGRIVDRWTGRYFSPVSSEIQYGPSKNDIRRLLGTPNSVYWDEDGGPLWSNAYISPNRRGAWVLKRQYWGSRTSENVAIGKVTDEIRTCGRYVFIPCAGQYVPAFNLIDYGYGANTMCKDGVELSGAGSPTQKMLVIHPTKAFLGVSFPVSLEGPTGYYLVVKL